MGVSHNDFIEFRIFDMQLPQSLCSGILLVVLYRSIPVDSRIIYENHYKFFTPLIIRTFGLLLLRITTNLQECTEITTFATPPTEDQRADKKRHEFLD